ncbi:MAG: cation transporter [Ruminococcaceae bacterium]|nr:cation transporter [Oscillospiraceae bacterium]
MTNWLIRLFVKNADDVKSPAVHTRYGWLAGLVGVICNVLLAAGKFVAGLLSGSIAIMGDAVNNLSDAAASVITLVGFKLGAKPADREHPFGHARFEYVAGLVVALLVMVIGVELFRTSIGKIITPEPVDYSWVALIMLAVSILVKLWMALFNRNIGRRIGSATLQATFVDSRNDMIATAAVLIAALVARFTGLNLDGWMGLAVAVFILISGIGMVRQTLNPLLGTAPDPEYVQYIAHKIESYPGVLGTHDLIVHDYGPGRRFASAHVEMDSDGDVLESHDVIDNIERDFLEQDQLHLIIHYDPIVTGDAMVDSARRWAQRQVEGIDPQLALHDFRLVDGPSHTNYIFDVAVPPGYPTPPAELTQKIEAALQHGSKPIRLVLTVDDAYSSSLQGPFESDTTD